MEFHLEEQFEFEISFEIPPVEKSGKNTKSEKIFTLL